MEFKLHLRGMYLIWIYISILLLILISQIFYRVKDIKVIRVFGFELIGLLFYLLVLILIIGGSFSTNAQILYKAW